MSPPAIICFAGDDWDGNPHSRHHIMRRLAPEFEVLFVEGVPMRSVSLGGSDRHELRRVAAKLRAGTGLRTVAEGLHVLRPLPIPPAGRAGRRAQLEALRVTVLRALHRLGLDGPRLAWFSLPVVAPLLGRLGERGSVLYYQDRYDEFSHVDRQALARHVTSLATRCDATIASAEPLAADLRELGATPVVIPHGVEVDLFAGNHPLPADLAGLERPLVGCIGLIDDHLEMDAIVAIADRLQDRGAGTVVFVGAANTSTARLIHPRIALLGRRPYNTMPAYMSALDCALVPFARTRLTEAVNPIKLREYLAAGCPVVSTSLPTVAPYADTVTLANNPEEFGNAVASVLDAADSPAAVARRRARVAGETWDATAAAVREILRKLLALPDQLRTPRTTR